MGFTEKEIGRMKTLTVSTEKGTVDIDYQDLKLITVNSQLCFFYESEEGDLVMPIARSNRISKLYGENKSVRISDGLDEIISNLNVLKQDWLSNKCETKNIKYKIEKLIHSCRILKQNLKK